jgi:HK97 family phage major capsid protein
MGRPLIFSEACNSLGNQGDIFLCDLSQYQFVTKAGGVKTDISIHVFFEYHTAAFRFVLRCAGTPLWPAAVAARTGGGFYSPYITLDERA